MSTVDRLLVIKHMTDLHVHIRAHMRTSADIVIVFCCF